MKSLGFLFAGLLVGGIVGFYIGNSYASLKDYRELKQISGMTDEQMKELWKDVPKLRESMRKEDEMTARVSLAALLRMESGEENDTKHFLARHVASFYYVYGPPDDPQKKLSDSDKQFLLQIESIASSNSVLHAEISKRMNDER